MNRTPVEINIPMNPRRATIIVDGKHLDAVSSLHIDASVHDFPRLTLDLVGPVRFHGNAEVRVLDSTAADLKQLGWSEPGQYAHLAAAIRDLLDAISDMAIRNSDVDTAAGILRGELVDAGWEEDPNATLDV